MVFDVAEVLPVGSKPPAADVVRIFKAERYDLGAAAPFSTTTSFLQWRVGGSAFTPKLLELVFGPGSTRPAEKLSLCIACTALAALSVRSRVLLSADSSATLVRRGYRASCFQACFTPIICSQILRIFWRFLALFIFFNRFFIL